MLGFVGCGNMAQAMLKGILAKGLYKADEIIVSRRTKEALDALHEELGVQTTTDNKEVAEKADVLVLAIKPYQFADVIPEIAPACKENALVISIAAGQTIANIEKLFGKTMKIVRTMPNTPALVGEGMTGISYNKEEFTIEERDTIEQFFQSFGEVVTVPEHLMSAVVCASGSSPAYAYMFIEALADSVVKYGIPRQDAYKLAAQTLLGSAKMVLQTGEHPGKLKDNVCSPAGTTIQGVAALEEYGFRNAVIKATDKCYEACTKIK